jgi:ubiquinone biosynthesis protein UbiJ
MAVNSADTKSLSGTGVNISGDLETLRKLNIIMANLEIDWEAALAELIGDVAAHIFCSNIRNSAEFRAKAAQRVTATVVDVAQNQWQLTPDRGDFEQLTQQVRSIATDTDRLAARIERLRKLLPSGGPSL